MNYGQSIHVALGSTRGNRREVEAITKHKYKDKWTKGHNHAT